MTFAENHSGATVTELARSGTDVTMACNCNKIIVIIPASKFGLCAFCMQVTLAGFICSWVLVAPFLFIRVPTALFIVLTLPAALFTIWLALHLAAYFWKVARQAIRPHLPGSA